MKLNSSHIEFAGHRFEIRRRAYQRNLILRVQPNGSLRVSCSRGVPIEEIQKFLLKNQTFIERNLRKVGEWKEKHPRLEFITGERVLLRGQRLPLDVIWRWQSGIEVNFLEDRVEILAPLRSTREQRQRAVMQAYMKVAEGVFRSEALECSALMDLHPLDLELRSNRSQWGSCSSRGLITLNWKLLAAPPEVLRYVIIHELAHLVYQNHSAKYWKLVAIYCPQHKAMRRWLQDHHYEFEFLEPKSSLHGPIKGTYGFD